MNQGWKPLKRFLYLPLCLLTSLKRGVNQTQRLKVFARVCDGIRPEGSPLTPCFSRVMPAAMKRWNRLSGFILAPFQTAALHEQLEFFSKASPSMVLPLVCNVPGDLWGSRVETVETVASAPVVQSHLAEARC
jgi:hypothetical protein